MEGGQEVQKRRPKARSGSVWMTQVRAAVDGEKTEVGKAGGSTALWSSPFGHPMIEEHLR